LTTEGDDSMKVETAVTAVQAVSVLNHLKNNRLEYLIVVGIFTMLGWTSQATSYVQGVCF
jgi:isochorismate hydrolase